VTKGALLLATPHDEIDYIGFAKLAAKLIEKHLGIDTYIHVGGKQEGNVRAFRWHDQSIQTVQWYNADRTLAYDISPFEQTLLIDVDYLTFNNSLLDYFDKDFEFLCYDRVFDVTNTNSFYNDMFMTKAQFPMRWATVIYFRKCSLAYEIFEQMKIIQTNWKYYADLFGFSAGKYRNDFSLSIAHQLQSGYTDTCNVFNHSLNSISTTDEIYKIEDGNLYIRYHNDDTYNAIRVKDVNIHCMNKLNLTEKLDELMEYANA